MDEEHILRLIIISYFLIGCISAADDNCRSAYCALVEPGIRFPFRIIGQQPSGCGFPGFDLSCDKQNRTIIQLSSSRSYVVNRIDYLSQVIYLEQDFCHLDKINSFNLAGTPFIFSSLWSYTFYNCSIWNLGYMYPAVRIPCLSSANYLVYVVRTDFFPPENMTLSCEVIKTINVPIGWDGDIKSELELMWLTPSCTSCEREGKPCGLAGCLGSTHDKGISTGAKYGLSIGIGVPVSICLISLICYVASRGDHSENHQEGIDFFPIASVPQPPSRTGLDGSTIESYPKITLGENCRLPNDESTCAICLSDYKPKESLRTIPECNHYFHTDCIDEWLKLNTTCPVCRNAPESSSVVTPRSTTSMTPLDTLTTPLDT